MIRRELILRVLHIINDLKLGGAQKLLVDLIPIINQSGDVRADILILSSSNNVFFESLINNNVAIKITRYNRKYDPRSILEVCKCLKDGDYDIVHSHLFPAQYWLAIAKMFLKKSKIKYVTSEHNTYNNRRKWFFFKPIDRFIYSKYDLIISVSKKTEENLIDWINPKNNRLAKNIVIENGVDLLKIEDAQAYRKTDLATNIGNNTRLVCMAGRFTQQKDQPTLIRAMGKLPDNVHLLLLGEGELQGLCENLAHELNISHRVHFLGFRLDVPEILKTVDIVVQSSHWEGFGLAAVEGMAAGKPLIASNVEGLSEVVYGYGMIFEKGNDSELASLISKLIGDKDLYNETATICKKRSGDFSIQQNAKDLLIAYRTIK